MRRKEAGFIAAQAAIFVGVIALVSLPLQFSNNAQVSTSSTASEGPLVFASGVSPQGLQLEVKLNSSSIRSHGAISGRVEVLNTLDRNVSLSGLVQNQNISEWNGDDYLCANGPSLFVGFALFRGHFAAGNISAAGQPLQLAPPEVILCGISFPPSAVTFLPEGDQAAATNDGLSYPVTISINATTGYCKETRFSGSGGEINCAANPGLVGYWNNSVSAGGDLNFTSPAFVYFPPGEYTIAATDLWNQYVYATFVVHPGDSSQTSSATSDATACGVGNQVISLNNTEYCADNVANDTVIGSPGYSYFRNESVTFEGVKFQTICPSTYQGCPGANSSASPVTLGIMRFTMTFPDGTNETDSSVIEDGYYAQILSSHSDPRAGMLIEITYGAHATTHVYLLSSSLGNPYSCPINVTFLGETVPAVPAGPTTKITIENVVNSSIIRVNATLDLWNSFVGNQSGSLPHYHTYVFATVNGTNPLYPEQSISRTDVIINAVMAEGLTYQLTIQGELQNGSQFQCSTSVILGS